MGLPVGVEAVWRSGGHVEETYVKLLPLRWDGKRLAREALCAQKENLQKLIRIEKASNPKRGLAKTTLSMLLAPARGTCACTDCWPRAC